MRFVQIGFGIFMLGGLAAVGCGGGDSANNPPPGTGGKGGSAGSSSSGKGGGAGTTTTGGSAGTGGATGGSAGTGTGGSAGTGTGGSAGKGGGAGTGGSAGKGGIGMAGADMGGGQGGAGNGEACPANAPDDGDDCDNDVNPGNQDPCTYPDANGTTTCACTGFMNPTWNCQTLSCPTMAPDDGDMCNMMMNPGQGDDPCVYGMVECSCGGGMGGPGGMAQWNCAAPPMCPMMAPDDGDMCDTDTDPTAMDGGCEYGMTTCVCQGFGGGGQQWNCGTCPATAPDDNDDCDNMVNGFCAYPSGNCTCGGNDQWNCPN